MTHRNRFSRALVLSALLLSLGATGVEVFGAAAQPATNDPMRIVPADALFCIRINRLATSLGQVDQFLTGISPIGLSMPVQAQLGKLLGGPQPAGVNMTGDFAVFGPLPGGEKPDPKRLGVLIPVSDFQQFLTNPNVVKPDAQGILRINMEGKPIVAGIQMGNYLLFTRAEDLQALGEAKNWTSGASVGSLAQRLNPDEFKRANSSPVWAYANIQIAGKLYGPMIQQKIKEATQKMQENQAKGGPMIGPPVAAIDMWASLLNSFMQETQFVSLSLDPSAAAIRLAPVIAAVPNSDMAKILSLSSEQQPQPNLTGYMEKGAITTGVATFSPAFVRAVTLKRIDLMTALMGDTMSKENSAALRKLATDAADAFGGGAAWSFSSDPASKPPFRLHRVHTIRDRQRVNDVLDQVAKMMNDGAMAGLGKKFGVKIRFALKRNVETYKDIPIDAGTVTIQPTDANSPQAQQMKAVFAGELNLRFAVTKDLFLSTMAADPGKEIHTLIDQALSGGPGTIPSEVQTALQLLPEAKNASFFGTFNEVRAIQMGMAFAPMPMPQVEASSQSNIAFAGNIGNGRLLEDIAIPKQQVQEIMALFIKIQQQTMQEQPKPSEQPGAQPPSAPSKPPAGQPGQT
jgi:hypothetical protein